MINENELSREELVKALDNASVTLAPVQKKLNDINMLKVAMADAAIIVEEGPPSIIVMLFKFLFLFGVAMVVMEGIISIISSFSPGGPVIVFTIVVLLIMTIASIVISFRLATKKRTTWKKAKKELVRLNDELEQTIIDVKTLRIALCRDNDEILSFIPDKYRWPQFLSKLSSYVSDKRADSLKEAINILEGECITDEEFMFD